MPDTARYKRYLGDGVYADWNGYAVVLTTENGLAETNRIVLEGDVLDGFGQWTKRLLEQLKAEREASNAGR